MKLRTITVGKEFKVGLPSFSNLTSNCQITFEIADGEEVNWNQAWDVVNSQLGSQCANIEPNWIQSNEFKRFFKVTVRVPKGGVKNV